MSEDPKAEALKESAKLGIDVAKQFLTLALGGLAFIVGWVMAGKTVISSALAVCCVVLFGISVLFGLLFLMCAVGHINKDQNYNVYTPTLRFLSSLQILLFMVGVALLAVMTFTKVISSQVHGSAAELEIKMPGKEIRQPVYPNSVVNVTITETGRIEIAVKP